MRLWLPFAVVPVLVSLVLVSPAQAEALRPPVDEAVWRVIEGAGADEPWAQSVGLGATIAGSLAVALPATLAMYMLVWAMSAVAGRIDGVLFVTGVTYAVLGPTVAVILALEGLVTRTNGRWWAGGLVAPTIVMLSALAVAALASTPGFELAGIAIGLGGGVVLTAVGAQFAAFGPPRDD